MDYISSGYRVVETRRTSRINGDSILSADHSLLTLCPERQRANRRLLLVRNLLHMMFMVISKPYNPEGKHNLSSIVNSKYV